MQLNEIRLNPGSTKPKKRLGRGTGSGLGKTSGKGHKGQKARSGVSIKGFEGGQMPIHRRLPKRGFKSLNKKVFSLVSLESLKAAIEAKKLKASEPITSETLIKAGLIRCTQDGVKLLANGGEINVALTLHVDKASKAAVEVIEKAGGQVIFNKA